MDIKSIAVPALRAPCTRTARYSFKWFRQGESSSDAVVARIVSRPQRLRVCIVQADHASSTNARVLLHSLPEAGPSTA